MFDRPISARFVTITLDVIHVCHIYSIIFLLMSPRQFQYKISVSISSSLIYTLTLENNGAAR